MKRFCQYVVIITLIFAFALPSVVPAQVGSNPLSQFLGDADDIKKMVDKAINQAVLNMARFELKMPLLPKVDVNLLEKDSDVILINIAIAHFKILFEKNAREKLKDLPGLKEEEIKKIIADSWDETLKKIKKIIEDSLNQAREEIRITIENIKECITKELQCLRPKLEGIVDNLTDQITDALKDQVILRTRDVFLKELAKLRADIPGFRVDINKLIYEPQNALVRQTVIPFPLFRIAIDTRAFAFIVPKIRTGIYKANMLTSFGIQISNLLFELENEMRKIADIMVQAPDDAGEQLAAIKNVIGFKLNTVINLLKQYLANLPPPPALAEERKALKDAITLAETARLYIANLKVEDLGELIEEVGKIEAKRLKALEAELEAIEAAIQESQDLIDELPTLSEEKLRKLLEELEEDSK